MLEAVGSRQEAEQGETGRRGKDKVPLIACS
jgi:hypothetical protein